LDGHGVDIVFRRTSQLTRAECVELCDFIQAWAVEHGVELRDAVPWIDQKARQTSPFMGRKESADSEAVPWADIG
jgi:hypothetical protein